MQQDIHQYTHQEKRPDEVKGLNKDELEIIYKGCFYKNDYK